MHINANANERGEEYPANTSNVTRNLYAKTYAEIIAIVPSKLNIESPTM